MTAVKIKDIKGALVEKKNLNNYCYTISSAKEFNDMIDKKGEITIGMNPKLLRQTISNVEVPYADTQTGRVSL